MILSHYEDKELIVFYAYLNGKDDEEKIQYINSLIDDSYENLVILSEGLESSSFNYESCIEKFSCNVASLLSSIPEELTQINIKKFPTAIFIDKGIIADAYGNVLDKESMKKAIQVFLGEDCIAYKANN